MFPLHPGESRTPATTDIQNSSRVLSAVLIVVGFESDIFFSFFLFCRDSIWVLTGVSLGRREVGRLLQLSHSLSCASVGKRTVQYLYLYTQDGSHFSVTSTAYHVSAIL